MEILQVTFHSTKMRMGGREVEDALDQKCGIGSIWRMSQEASRTSQALPTWSCKTVFQASCS